MYFSNIMDYQISASTCEMIEIDLSTCTTNQPLGTLISKSVKFVTLQRIICGHSICGEIEDYHDMVAAG